MRKILMGLIVGLMAVLAHGNTQTQVFDDALRRQQEQLDAIKAQQAPPSVLSARDESISASFDVGNLPKETLCFPIKSVVWDGVEHLAYLTTKTTPLIGQCIGIDGLRVVQSLLTKDLLQRGYITTRVVFPEQNLSSGTLKIQLIEGKVSDIEALASLGYSGFAIVPSTGDILNQKDIDQSLENIRFLSGQQNAAFEIEPGQSLGDSKLVLKPENSKRWALGLILDDSGSKSTGKYQMGANLTLDSPLFLYDSLNLSLNNNANYGNNQLNSNANSVSWRLPLAYWAFDVGASWSKYKQTVAGFSDPIEYSGNSRTVNIGLSRVFYRSGNAKTMTQVKLARKLSQSAVDNEPIAIQKTDFVTYDMSIDHHQNLARGSSLDFDLGYKGSVPKWSKQVGVLAGQPDWDGRYGLWHADLHIKIPVAVGSHRFMYQQRWRMQHTDEAIPSSEYFSIGSRYSVRGFNDIGLSSQKGVQLRTDYIWLLGNHSLYLGMDAGRVSGDASQALAGKVLAGFVLGAKGRLWRINYDVTAGRPIVQPQGFPERKWTSTVWFMFNY